MIKKIVIAMLVGFSASLPATAAVYTIDTVHSSIGFKVRHLVSKTTGSFGAFSGTLDYDEKKPENLKIKTIIQTASINTNDPKRDEHLKSKDFFNVETYPTMTFQSTKVVSEAGGTLKVIGNLSMLGVTKPVTLNVQGGQIGTDPWENVRTGFLAAGSINRKDWGMVFNIAMDKGGVVIGDDVEILIEIEGVKKQ